jgi:uncharacterized repeat protein (TIGR01451 family)
MKKLLSYWMFAMLVLQAVVPAMNVKAQVESSAEQMPAGLHLALLDAAAGEAEPIEAAPDGYVLQEHGLDVNLADGHFSAKAQEGAEWEFNLRLSGVGRGDRIEPVQGARAEQNEAGRVEYRYAGVTEWYRNTTLGIQQGFTVDDQPQGNGRLVLHIQLNTELSGILSEDERSLSFETGDGQVLRYADLRAYDANGAELEARLIYNPAQIVIQVEDREAVYPLMIDPLIYLEQKVLTVDGAAGDAFGASVALSGDTALVGAYGDDSSTGSAYIFERNAENAWHQTAKLTASDSAASDLFGYSVALSGDTALVSAVGDDNYRGSAYVFVKPVGGWGNMTETAKLTASDAAANDYFGASVALSGDTALVGAYGDDSTFTDQGSAYVFVKPAGGWATTSTYTAKLTASDGAADDFFGWSVALSGDTALVGALYKDNGAFTDQGSAYVFVKPAAGWATTSTYTAKLTASDGTTDDYFGYSVALSGDTALVGVDGDDVSFTDQGSAYVFVKPAAGWATTSTYTAKLTASDGAASDDFGASVALSGDTALVGADWDDNFQGSAYVFVKPGSGWATTSTHTAKLNASDGAASDNFGYSVAVSGDTTLVGAFLDDAPSIDQGSAYFYQGYQNNYDLGVNATVSDSAPTVGDSVLLTARVLNYGPTSASDVLLNASLPAGLTYVSHVATHGSYDPNTGVWSAGNLATGVSATLTITATVNPSAGGATLTFTATSLIPDLEASNNSASAGMTVPFQEFLTNNSFETDTAIPLKVPDEWTKGGTWAAADGRNCIVKRTGACSLKFTGNSNLKSLSYTVLTSGVAGDDYQLQLYSKASSVPTTGTTYRVSVSFMNGTTLVNKVVKNFAKGTHNFALASLPVSAIGTYDRIIVKIEFKATSGTAWFDDASLVFVP